MSVNSAVFLDKDGTLVQDIPYNVDPNLIRLSHGALQSLRKLDMAGYKLIVVSNQSGVARGYFNELDLLPVIQCIRDLLARDHIKLAGFYYCPHHPQGIIKPYARQCDCRKPRPGLLIRAARQKSIHLPSSWMIGDILNDIEAGNQAGCRTILLDNGNETEWKMSPMRRPDFIVNDLSEAAQVILRY